LVLITFKKMTGVSESPSINKIINGILVLSIIMLIFTLSKPSGFASLGLVIILLMFYKLKTGSSASASV